MSFPEIAVGASRGAERRSALFGLLQLRSGQARPHVEQKSQAFPAGK